jgi:hypothetical protein
VIFVLDASAMISFLRDERGADVVAEPNENPRRIESNRGAKPKPASACESAGGGGRLTPADCRLFKAPTTAGKVLLREQNGLRTGFTAAGIGESQNSVSVASETYGKSSRNPCTGMLSLKTGENPLTTDSPKNGFAFSTYRFRPVRAQSGVTGGIGFDL